MSHTAAQSAPAPHGPAEPSFLLYEEHSVYRRDLIGRARSMAEALTLALAASRRNRQPVSVRRRDAGSITSVYVASYLSGKRIYPEAADAAGAVL